MLGLFRFLVLLIVITLSGCGQIEFTFSGGQQKSLEEFKNRRVVINYWASWCKPCIEEIPQLNTLNKSEDIVVFGINYDGILGEELARQAATLGIEYDLIVSDPAEALKVDRPRALPATVLIDRQGNTREVLYGPQTADSISERFNSLEQGE